MKNRILLISVITLLFVSFNTLAQEPMIKEFDAKDIEKLIVKNDIGQTLITGNETEKISVTAITEHDGCEITIQQEKNNIIVKNKNNGDHFWEKPCKTNFSITLPKNIEVEAKNGEGNLMVENMTNIVKTKTGSGSTFLKNVSGTYEGKSGSGDIKGTLYSEEVRIRIGSGDIDLEGFLSKASIKTGSGDVKIKWNKSLDKGSFEGKSGSGDYTLLFPKDMKTKVRTDIKLGSGETSNQLGDNPEADFKIKIRAGSGDVDIRKY